MNFELNPIRHLDQTHRSRVVARAIVLFSAIFVAFSFFGFRAGDASAQDRAGLRIGERLTYSISYDRFQDAGFAEIWVASKGKLAGRDVVELRSRMKTHGFVASAFYSVDESRTVFVSPETGLPAFARISKNTGISPVESVINFAERPAGEYDLLSFLFALRSKSASSGAVFENGQSRQIGSQIAGSEKIKTDAGEFETSIVAVQSDYFAELGITDFRVNVSNDGREIPVLFRFRIGRGEFRVELAGISNPEPAATPSSTPTPNPSPKPSVTPRPTPKPYVDNQPLGSDIPFEIGEVLDFRLTSNGRPAGSVRLEARERKQVTGYGNRDGLLLTATMDDSPAGSTLFKKGNSVQTWVDPLDLQPIASWGNVAGSLSILNPRVRFDQDRGVAQVEGAAPIQVPVNTHNLLSLIYAVRSFNLKPSKDATNPVNDTRVAVFLGDRFYVFMLRPSTAQLITMDGEKIAAQMITVITGDPELDGLGIRIWLSNEQRRRPLRIAAGAFQADLVTATPKANP